ncbi:MAG: hypothetical protein HY905_04010 [Deltaproteobacteria bacterium]|nr:hypothetical protein [Deltaproteobacteria bacterium]
MSRDMRPEVRRWGPSAGMFVSAATAIDLLAAVSQAQPEIAMEHADEASHDVSRIRWEDGAAILDRFASLDERIMSFVIAEVEELRGGPIRPETDVLAFLGNLRSNAESWRACLDPDDGSLELLLDA